MASFLHNEDSFVSSSNLRVKGAKADVAPMQDDITRNFRPFRLDNVFTP